MHSPTTEERSHSGKALIKIKFTFSEIVKSAFYEQQLQKLHSHLEILQKALSQISFTTPELDRAVKSTKGLIYSFLRNVLMSLRLKKYQNNSEYNLNERFTDWTADLDTPQTQDLYMHVYMLVY